MNTPVTPTGIAPPAAAYQLAMRVTGADNMLFTAGIVGTRPDGTIADAIGEQASEMWRSVGVLLAESGFQPSDVVSHTTYVVVGHDLGEAMAVRDAFFGGHLSASTLIPVPALANPDFLIEVAVVAASG